MCNNRKTVKKRRENALKQSFVKIRCDIFNLFFYHCCHFEMMTRLFVSEIFLTILFLLLIWKRLTSNKKHCFFHKIDAINFNKYTKIVWYFLLLSFIIYITKRNCQISRDLFKQSSSISIKEWTGSTYSREQQPLRFSSQSLSLLNRAIQISIASFSVITHSGIDVQFCQLEARPQK